jgi:hypothetical protein
MIYELDTYAIILDFAIAVRGFSRRFSYDYIVAFALFLERLSNQLVIVFLTSMTRPDSKYSNRFAK